MSKINLKEFDIKNMNILYETKTKIGYNSNIKYNGEDFTIQTPSCEILDINQNCENPYYKIKFNSTNVKEYNFFKLIETNVINFIRKSNKTSYDTYKSSLTIEENYIIINVKLSNSTLFFDKNTNQITKYDVKIGDKIISILNTKGIWMDEKSSTLRWCSVQILKMI